MILTIIIAAVLIILAIYARKRYKDERITREENVVHTFSVDTMSDLKEGTIDDFEEALEKKREEIETHVTWYVSSSVKIQMETVFARRIHDAENDVRVAGYDLKLAELKLRKSLKEIEEFHLKMAKFKQIKRRRYDHKLITGLIERWKEAPYFFFRSPVENPVENYSTGFELWCIVTFRKVHKAKFLKEAIMIQSKAATAMSEFLTAMELQKQAKKDLNRLLALRQEYKEKVYIMLP